MVDHFRVRAATLGALGLGVIVVVAWSGSVAASAATRLRSGSVHAQLASHVTNGTNAISSGLPLRGSGIMAAIVGLLALSSLAFLVVTFVRRRVDIV